MNRFFTRLLAACLMAASLSALAATQAPGTSPDELVRAAQETLQKTDADRLAELWDAGSGLLKNRVAKAAFIESTRKARQAMGPVKDRDWSGVMRVRYLAGNEAGLPAGLYANVDFATHLASGKTAAERISFVLEGDGWRFTGYVATPPATGASPAAIAPVAAAPITPTTPAASATTPSAPGASVGEVEGAVRAWAAAWSARDVDRYLAAYAPDFAPPGSQDRKRWAEERRARIADKTSISVTIEDLVVSINGQSANARFRQVYRADKLNNAGRKTLELERSGNQWLIRKESAGG